VLEALFQLENFLYNHLGNFTAQIKAQLASAILSTPTPSTACLLGAMSNSSDQARKDVNNALINTDSKDVNSKDIRLT